MTSRAARLSRFASLALLVCALPRPGWALTLAEAMAAAARATETAAIAALATEGAQADVRTARGSVLPVATLSGSSTRNSEAVDVGGSSFVRLWDHEANLRVSVDIFRGAAIPGLRAAHALEDAAAASSTAELAALRLAAARAYLAALASAQNVSDAQAAVQLRQASFEQAQVLADGGYAVGADLSRAEFSLVEAESALAVAEGTLDDNLAALRVLVGDPSLEASDLETPTLPTVAVVDALTADREALAYRALAAERNVVGRWLTFLPTLSVAGQYTLGAESLRAPDGRSWFITFSASWDLFDGARYGQLDRARVDAEVAALEVSDAERRQAEALRTAERQLQTARRQLELADRARELAAATRALEAERFSGGDLTVLDLVSADADLFRSEVTANIAALDAALAQVELAYLTGLLEDDAWLSR